MKDKKARGKSQRIVLRRRDPSSSSAVTRLALDRRASIASQVEEAFESVPVLEGVEADQILAASSLQSIATIAYSLELFRAQ